jgi:putative membrane protein insertion efficiency factor
MTAPSSSRLGRAPRRCALAVLAFYRGVISPALPPSCRYTPSCSAYAVEAIERFGLMQGGWLAVRRLLRCHPWHRGGHDPVPSLVVSSEIFAVATATNGKSPRSHA